MRNALLLLLLTALAPAGNETLPASALIQPEELAARLGARQPLLLHVGFGVLYRGKHIPGSQYAGPGAKPQGLELLKQALAKVPHDREIVLYCGCCPWQQCPNLQPAYAALREWGFERVKVLRIPVNFTRDWIDRGYPVESGK